MTSKSSSVFIEALESRIAPAGLASIDLSSLSGPNGFKIAGGGQTDLGITIANAGDLNGDGLDDVVIGASGDTGNTSGAVYVIFGKKTGLPAALDPATLDGTNGFRLVGEATGDQAGASVAGAGDVNGDGFADLVIGAPTAFAPSVSSGAVYVFYGHAGSFAASTNLGALGAGGTKIVTANPGDLLGSAVAKAGDVNGDGYDDLVIAGSGIRDLGVIGNGAAFVVFGKAGGLGASFTLSTLNGANGFKTVLDTNNNPNQVGQAVGGAGDLNGDGYDDVIVTAPTAAEGGSKRGAAFVIFGKPSGFTAAVNLATLTGASGFKISGATDNTRIGDSVSGIGDLNADGFDDLVVGAQGGVLGDTGAAYVLFGRAGGFGAGLTTTGFDGTNGFKVSGIASSDALGVTGGRGDFNADGIDDLLLGAPGTTGVGASSGTAYVVFGKSTPFSATFNLATLDGANGLRLLGATANGSAGSSVGFGDFNGDGFADVFVGAPKTAGSTGAAFVALGSGLLVKISPDGKTATFTENDGDLVTVKISKGLLQRDDLRITSDGIFQKLELLSDNGAFGGAAVSVTAKKAAGGTGDGKANLGALDARGSDLGKVVVSGNLGQIDAGDANPLTAGLAALTVGSLGGDASTQPAGTVLPYLSRIEGSVKMVTIAGDLAGVLDVRGKLGAVKVGRDLTSAGGGDANGLIRASSDIGSVSIAGNLQGGSATTCGVITEGKLGKVSIGGTVVTNVFAKPATISALGKINPTTAADAVAIGSVAIKGGASSLRILAGYAGGLAALNGDASIGSVSVGGGILGVSVVAGVADTSVKNNLSSNADGFGRNDTALGGGNANLVARIGSIVVKGNVIANAAFFGFTAEQIGKVSVSGKSLTLSPTAKDTVGLLSINMQPTNVNVVEV